MASVVEICNGALNQLGASTILTLTEDSYDDESEDEALALAEQLILSVKFARAVAGKPTKLELVK